MMESKEKLTKAKYGEWQASLFGACLMALGLGVYFANYIAKFTPIIILIGVILHGWGMYKIHKRNK
jgi:hypothetical protein